VTQFVQSFITRVVQDIEEVVMLTTGPMGQPSLQGEPQRSLTQPPVATTGSNVDTVDDKEMDVKYWDVSMVKQQERRRPGNKAATAAAAAAVSAAGAGAGARGCACRGGSRKRDGEEGGGGSGGGSGSQWTQKPLA